MEKATPVTFISSYGTTIRGLLHPVSGAGCPRVWHLFVNNYFRGVLRMIDGKWVFHGDMYSELAEFFGSRVAPNSDKLL